MFLKSFMNCSLKTRMTLLYTLLAVFFVGGISFYAYYFTVELLKEKEMSILSDSLEYLEKDIHIRFKEINSEFVNIFDDTKFINLYMKHITNARGANENVALNNEFHNYFFDIKLRNSDLIEAVYLFSNGDIFSSEHRPKFEFAQFVESPYYGMCMEQKNKILYSDLEKETDFFCVARSFYYTVNKENTVYPGVGYISEDNEDYSILIFFLKKEYLRKLICEEADKRQTNVLILNQDGDITVQEGEIYSVKSESRNDLLEAIRGDPSWAVEGEAVEGRAGINIRPMGILDWKIIYMYDMNILYRQAGQIRHVALVIFAVSVVGVISIATLISRSVVRPIEKLAKVMDEVGNNHMEVNFVPKYNDEIAYLGGKFSEMVRKISDLMVEVKYTEEQKRVEELKALQAQINPHFLYNTLDTVYWMDKIDGNDKAANLVADLADFFRLSLNKGEDITTVHNEVEHVRKYLEIQKVRMEGKFDYEIICRQNELLEYRVIKFILQPFAENALLHGFDNISWKGKITIEVLREKDNILFYIIDNGKGMPKSEMEELNCMEKWENDNHGYAIQNVKARIRIYAGEQFGVQFDQSDTNGVRVRICFPIGF